MCYLIAHGILDVDKLAIDELDQDLLRIWNWAKHQLEGCKLKQALPLLVNGRKFLKISLGKHMLTVGVRVNPAYFIF